MTATNEAWISDSLARLEQLESQREQLASSGRTDALAEIDEEIKSLYEVLESAAEEEASAANTSPTPDDIRGVERAAPGLRADADGRGGVASPGGVRPRARGGAVAVRRPGRGVGDVAAGTDVRPTVDDDGPVHGQRRR